MTNITLHEGSEAVESAMKLVQQYWMELTPGSPRTRFIARKGSWHGCTLGALSLGDFKPRKAPFDNILHDNVSHVSACDPYHGLRDGETIPAYVERLKQLPNLALLQVQVRAWPRGSPTWPGSA